MPINVAAISSPARKPISAVTEGAKLHSATNCQPTKIGFLRRSVLLLLGGIQTGDLPWVPRLGLLNRALRRSSNTSSATGKSKAEPNAQSRIEQEVTEGTEDSACENSNLSVISVTSCSGLSFFSLLASHVSTAEPKRLSSGTRSKLPDSLTQSCGRGILTAI